MLPSSWLEGASIDGCLKRNASVVVLGVDFEDTALFGFRVSLKAEDVQVRDLDIHVWVFRFTFESIVVVDVNSARLADRYSILEIRFVNYLAILHDRVILHVLSYEILSVGQELKLIPRVNIIPVVQSLRTHLVVLKLNGAHGIVLIVTVVVREKAVHLIWSWEGRFPHF